MTKQKCFIKIPLILAVLLCFVGIFTVNTHAEEGEYEDIQAGDKKEIVVEDNSRIRFRFVPEESGLYCIYSSGDTDIKVTLRDEEMNSIVEDDDSYAGYNFFLMREYAANQVYYFEIDSFGEGSSTITLKKNSVENISFEPKEPIKLIENIDGSKGYHGDDPYFHYTTDKYYLVKDGDILKVTEDNKTTEYAFNSDHGYFECEGEEAIPLEAIEISSDQDNTWEVGKHLFTVSYMGITCKLDIEIVENSVKSIQFDPAKPIQLIENLDGDWDKYYDPEIDDWVEYFNYDCSAGLYKDGNVLTVTNAVGSKDYTYSAEKEAFVNGSDMIPKEEVSFTHDQRENPWKLGENTISVIYSICSTNVSVKVVPKVVPDTRVEEAIKLLKALDENSDEKAVQTARDAYEALDEGQKAAIDPELVKNLEDQEKRIEDQKNVGNEPQTVPVSRVMLQGISNKIAAGKKITLKATVLPEKASNKKLKWTSSNPKVATVNQNGVVVIKKKTGGKKIVIKAEATDGSKKSGIWKIVVMKGAVKKIAIKGAKKKLKAGKSMKLKAVVKATKGKANKKVMWTTSNKKYAIVSKSGKVKALKAGKGKKVKITATATDGTGKKKDITFKIQ